MEKTVTPTKEPEVVVDDMTREIQDPLVRFFKKSGKEFFWTVVAVLAIVYGYQRFQETRLESQRDSADIYYRVQREVAAVESAVTNLKAQKDKLLAAKEPEKKSIDEDIKKAESEVTTAKARAQSAIESLSDARPPYREISKFYAGVLSYKLGDKAASMNAAGDGWRTLPDGPERITAELSAYLAAKVKLDMPEQRATGLAELVALVKEGAYAAVPAAASIQIVAETQEERDLAAKEIESLGKRRPEQLDLLTSLNKSL
jgi:hypothetical protein